MKNLNCCIMVSIAIILLVLKGFNFWAFMLLIAGIMSYEYLPEKYVDLYREKLELEVALLKKQVKERK